MATKERKSSKSKSDKKTKVPKDQKLANPHSENGTMTVEEQKPVEIESADIEMKSATDDQSPTNSPPDNDEPNATKATKRKNAIDELEVDVTAPEPPSKRAKRALKKGKTLSKKSKKDNDDDDLMEDDADDADTKEKKKERSEHSVWIGNLPFTVTALQLKKWLVDNSGGTIAPEMITRIKIPKSKLPGRDKEAKPENKGFAYVDFIDISAKVAAIALSENDLGARKLLIKDATSFEGRPKKEEPVEGADGQAEAFNKWADAPRKVFVGNMGFKTTEEDIRRNFEKCGEIEFVKMATFEDTGKCKGYGWVTFKDGEAAAWAVKGFVKIKEQIETEDDFKEASDDDEPKQQQKQFKTRKWWVNRMMGRELKLELAEDDHVRYKKRFGKDGLDKDGNPNIGADKRKKDAPKAPVESASMKASDDITVARLTGAVVKPTGTKMNFD